MQRPRKLLGLLLAFILIVGGLHVISASEAGAASPTIDRIKKRGTLIAGTAGSMPPLNMTTTDGKVIGLDADLAKIIASSMGVKLELKTMPFAKLLPALKSGELDMVLSSMTMTPERNLQFAFVGPYFVSGKSFVTKEQKLLQAETPADINTPDTTLVALKGSTSQSFVEELIPKAKLITTEHYDQAVEMLLMDKVDALVADYPFCYVTAYRHRDKGLVTLVKPLTFEPLGIALPPNDPLLVNWLTNVLLTLEGSGVLDKRRTRWFKSGDWLQQLP